ncbi:MAG: hypothetical protein K2Q10_00880, partial [Rhodospirillales bacterium]|nr:hypothetical protein [Rhodospirillales bacterium]
AAGRIERNKPLLFGTFADINAMGRSSALGRTMAEQIASRFAQRGYAVTEVKLRDSLLVDHGGEFILSRDASVIAKTQDARAVVTGTYSMANRKVFVNARVIDAWNGRVLAAYDFVLPMDREIRSLSGSF